MATDVSGRRRDGKCVPSQRLQLVIAKERGVLGPKPSRHCRLPAQSSDFFSHCPLNLKSLHSLARLMHRDLCCEIAPAPFSWIIPKWTSHFQKSCCCNNHNKIDRCNISTCLFLQTRRPALSRHTHATACPPTRLTRSNMTFCPPRHGHCRPAARIWGSCVGWDQGDLGALMDLIIPIFMLAILAIPSLNIDRWSNLKMLDGSDRIGGSSSLSEMEPRPEHEEPLIGHANANAIARLHFIFRRCLSYLMNGMPQQALNDAMQALVISPTWPTAFYLQAAALFSLGKENDAREALKDGSALETRSGGH